jgi:hypothetical protein
MKLIALSIIAVIIGALGLAGVYWWTSPKAKTEMAFECPELHGKSTATALKETPLNVGNIDTAVDGAERENAIRVVVWDLKKKYPKAKDDEIVNYLLTAYCPTVAQDSSLNNSKKKAKMDRFSSQVYQIVQQAAAAGEAK